MKESGFILVDKPAGITSFGVIARLRKITGIKKIGHAGTLDPFATGLLVVAIGREATREIDKYVKLDKEYQANIIFDKTTDTGDREGAVTFEYTGKKMDKDLIEKTIKDFLGKQEQTPPMFSAKKIGGKKLYELARKGKEVERKPSNIEIYQIELLDYSWPLAVINVSVSSGTYIRTLAEDIGKKLGCGGYLKELRRTRIGNFSISEATELGDMKEDNWQEKLF